MAKVSRVWGEQDMKLASREVLVGSPPLLIDNASPGNEEAQPDSSVRSSHLTQVTLSKY